MDRSARDLEERVASSSRDRDRDSVRRTQYKGENVAFDEFWPRPDRTRDSPQPFVGLGHESSHKNSVLLPREAARPFPRSAPVHAPLVVPSLFPQPLTLNFDGALSPAHLSPRGAPPAAAALGSPMQFGSAIPVFREQAPEAQPSYLDSKPYVAGFTFARSPHMIEAAAAAGGGASAAKDPTVRSLSNLFETALDAADSHGADPTPTSKDLSAAGRPTYTGPSSEYRESVRREAVTATERRLASLREIIGDLEATSAARNPTYPRAAPTPGSRTVGDDSPQIVGTAVVRLREYEAQGPRQAAADGAPGARGSLLDLSSSPSFRLAGLRAREMVGGHGPSTSFSGGFRRSPGGFGSPAGMGSAAKSPGSSSRSGETFSFASLAEGYAASPVARARGVSGDTPVAFGGFLNNRVSVVKAAIEEGTAAAAAAGGTPDLFGRSRPRTAAAQVAAVRPLNAAAVQRPMVPAAGGHAAAVPLGLFSPTPLPRGGARARAGGAGAGMMRTEPELRPIMSMRPPAVPSYLLQPPAPGLPSTSVSPSPSERRMYEIRAIISDLAHQQNVHAGQRDLE